MNSTQRKAGGKASAALAVAGIVVLLIWAVSLYSHGIWVDDHGAVGDGRPIDYVLFASGIALLVAALLIVIM
nr:hypothetical protein GCM10023233_30970 [Brevibacterium otitidis]